MSPGDPIERLRALCANVGFDLGEAQPALVARMRLLADLTETVADCERMAVAVEKVFRHYETTKPLEAFSPVERRTVVLGCLFSDVGKTGPASAAPQQQRLIAEMFGVEGVSDETQTVAEFLKTHFSGDADERLQRFAALGLDPKLSMREFWNLHSTWTLELVEAGGLPPEAIAAAATHHLLDNVNPDSIVGADLSFTRSFGDNRRFDRSEKLVILLDKYDAARRRSRLSHEQSIQWLRARLAAHPRFGADPELATLIGDLDVALAG